MKTRRTLLLILGALVAAAVAGGRGQSKAQVGEFGLDLAAMDRSVAPGDDFFRYVNGGWLKNTRVPEDAARFAEFGRLADVNAERNHSILDKAAASPTTPEERKVGDFYASLIDDAARQAD